MKWIVKIIDIEAYMITCLWNDNETRIVDLSNFIHEKAKNPKNSYSQLKDKNRFLEAKCDGTTIYWEDGVKMIDYDRTERTGPLDIDPHVLFEMCHRTDKTYENSVFEKQLLHDRFVNCKNRKDNSV